MSWLNHADVPDKVHACQLALHFVEPAPIATLYEYELMGLASSRQTLIANVAQQASAAATLFILPNVLTAPAFAETVYVAVLLSFIAMADLGLNYVHNRLVPALSSRGETEAIAHWDRTVHSFGLLTSLIFAGAVSFSYFAKFHSPLHSLLLFPVAPLTFLALFHVSRLSCLGDFLTYQRVAILRALLSVGTLPLAYLWGVTGWFVGTLLAAVALLAYIRKVSWIAFFAIDWRLVRDNVGEGLVRCCMTVLWVQLLNTGRLYASTHYSYTEIAEYGVAITAYQSLAALIIAALLPVSVEIMRRFGHSAGDAMQYAHQVAERMAPWTLLGTIAVAEVSPVVFRVIFPAYHLDPLMLASLVFGAIFYPFFIIWGSCMIGARRFFSYIVLILFGLAAAWLVAAYFDSDKRGAAIGQFAGLMAFSFAMYLIAPNVLNAPVKFWLRPILVFALTTGLGGSYWMLRWM